MWMQCERCESEARVMWHGVWFCFDCQKLAEQEFWREYEQKRREELAAQPPTKGVRRRAPKQQFHAWRNLAGKNRRS